MVSSSCLPISELLNFKLFAGFHVPVWLFDYRADCSKYSKTPKGRTTTAAVGGLQTGLAAGQGWGRLSLPHLWRWRGWSTCGALRLCVGHSSSVSKPREKSLLFSKIARWLLRVRSKEELNLRRFGHS